jgi:hypothetical protein
MSYFEYQAIYIGIIVGLAISNILISIHKLVEAGARVKWHWMAPATALYAATVTLAYFWVVWASQGQVGHRTFLTSLPFSIALGLLFLTCAASLPDDVPEKGLDLKQYYFADRRRLWGFSACAHVLNLMSWGMNLMGLGFSAAAIQHSLLPLAGNSGEAAISVSLMFVRAPWWHAIAFAALCAWVLFYFGPLVLH